VPVALYNGERGAGLAAADLTRFGEMREAARAVARVHELVRLRRDRPGSSLEKQAPGVKASRPPRIATPVFDPKPTSIIMGSTAVLCTCRRLRSSIGLVAS
jgi:hypothetical protein